MTHRRSALLGDDRPMAQLHHKFLDVVPDRAFDRITTMVARLLDVPIAMVSVPDKRRPSSHSYYGLEMRPQDRIPGLFESALLGNGPYVIADTRVDPRTATHPLVAGEFGLRFYAAVPLQSAERLHVGHLCCLDFKARQLAAADLDLLRGFAEIVMDQIELRQAARHVDELHRKLTDLHEKLRVHASRDSLTGLWNRGAIVELLGQIHVRARRAGRPTVVMMLDVDHFKQINDTYGHPAGDRALVAVAQRVKKALRAGDTVGRIGGEEFLCVLESCDPATALAVAERCRSAVCAAPVPVAGAGGPEARISISVGLVVGAKDADLPVEELLRRADEALYRAKQGGRNQVSWTDAAPTRQETA